MHNGQAPQGSDAAVDSSARPVRLAPLKEDLPPEKRALAEDLRHVFLSLGVSVRRYAARRHLDASSVTRYLNGDRVPPWSFIAGVVADLGETQAPLTGEAEEALRELHRAALRSNGRRSEVERLQDRLSETDEKTRRLRIQQRALEEMLQDRETRLAELRGRCRNLEMRLEQQHFAHHAELEVWREEYSDLQEEVHCLRQVLATTRTELIEAEERCHRLEARLETLHAGDGDEPDRPRSLMVMLEEADRTASVPELVRVVGDLELHTRKATAGELVRSVSRSRTVAEVAGLLIALRRAGYDAHVQTALPTMVTGRPVADIGALAHALYREGLDDYVLTLLQASVEFHVSADLVVFVRALDSAGLHEHAESLLGAVAAVRPVGDLVTVTECLARGELNPAVTTAMSVAAARRSVPDLVALSLGLREADAPELPSLADALQAAAARQRSASDVLHFVDSLALSGLGRDADKVFESTQQRGVGHLIALVYVLLQAHRYDDAWSVVVHASKTRPVDDLAALISDFYGAGRRQYAAELLIVAVRTRSAAQVRALLGALDQTFPGAGGVVRTAARTGTPPAVAALLTCMERCELHDHAEAIFQHALNDIEPRLLGEFLDALARAGSRYADPTSLAERARTAAVPKVARLLLALESVGMHRHLEAVVEVQCRSAMVANFPPLVMDVESLDSRRDPVAWPVVERILDRVVDVRSPADQAALASAFEATGRTRYAEHLVARASGLHGRRFRDELKKERARYERRGVSRALWLPAPDVREDEPAQPTP
ncbi:ATP/GTP-binding protein [Streptomyces sp. NPDC001406]|uniref:ATP/GTP-binding protein n=1 Tax=Streptomyces sp. NPDC001406 TaxID=3364572 RepID=UPI0036A3DAEA